VAARNSWQLSGAAASSPVGAELTWWGAVLPRAGQLVVADPLLPRPLMTALLSDAADDVSATGPRRARVVVVSLLAGGGLAAAVVMATEALQVLLLVTAAVGFVVWSSRMHSREHAVREREGARPLFAVRPSVGEPTWELLAHLDSQQAARPDDAFCAAARHLLWRVAHVSPRSDAAITRLTERARDGDLSSTDQLWAAAEDLTMLAVASPRDVRRSVPQLAVLFRYESGATR
jgi:hypothetical protein